MKIPLQISTRKMSLSNVALNVIKSKSKKLEKIYDRIIACRIMVEAPHKHKTQGLLYNVSIDISVPGADLAVKKEANEDVYVAIRDAFDSARRQLLHHSRRKYRKQKSASRESLAAETSRIDKDLETTFLNNVDTFTVYDVEYDGAVFR